MLAVCCVVPFSGCQSPDDPPSPAFASVTLSGRTAKEIFDTATDVFREEGYDTYRSTAKELVFEKEGTRANQLAHGGWIGDQGVRLRVRATLVPLDAFSHLLKCQGYRVSNTGDTFFEEEKRLDSVRGRPYQDLFDEIARRLK